MALGSVVIAQPSVTGVSGNFEDGEIISITGSGFGSNGPNVVLFDDFSVGNDGDQQSDTAAIGSWSSAVCRIFSDAALSNGQGARCVDEGQLTSKVTFPAATEVFVSSIAYVPPGYNFPDTSSPQTFPDRSALKHMWLLGGNQGYSESTLPDHVIVSWTGSNFYRVASNDPGQSNFDAGSDISWAWDEPVRITLWAKANGDSATGTDGMFQGVSSSGHFYRSYQDYKAWFNTNHTQKSWDQLNVLGYTRSTASFTTSGHNWVVDDVYVATGPAAAARVEIGDAPTYSSSTRLALSTPTTWADGSIQATFREGTFSSGSDAYLYVTDANGVVNVDGYPITVGTTSGTTAAPQAPQLSVEYVK